jgi:hypothetical protein
MKPIRISIFRIPVFLLCAFGAQAQEASSTTSTQTAAVPHLVRFTGGVKDANGQPKGGVAGVTFSLYKDDQGGVPLWIETQNVQLDSSGRYSVMLGATKADGVPADLFTSGEARWLGVQPAGQAEQTRVLLLSVPYALKAGDASTLGGLPPSAFVLAVPAISSGASSGSTISLPPASGAPPASSNVTTTGGTVNALPLFTTATNIQSSAITQTGSGATAKIGVGTSAPAATLDVNGSVLVRGPLQLHSLGTARAASGYNSNPFLLTASSFNSNPAKAISENFQWQAEATGNNTSSASGTLNLLFGASTTPTETGLKISSKGIFTFAVGQTFPGTGSGTVKSVGLTAPASDFTVSASPVTGTGTLNIAWTAAPTSTDTANTIVKRDGSGNFAGNTITAGILSGGAVTTTTATFTNLTAGAVTATNASLSNSLYVNSAAGVPLFVASNSGSATVIEGAASATSGDAWGVEGITNSNSNNGYGVYGTASASSGSPKGVYGQASSINGIGVFGQNGSLSSSGATVSAIGLGAWGDGGAAGGWGVVGTADDGYAGAFTNNTQFYASVIAQNNNASGSPLVALNNGNGSYCYVDSSGNLNCTGTKNAVVPLDGGKRRVAMSAIESPKNWFEDAGSADLENGLAVVALDPDFIQTVNTDQEYMVFPVPSGDCKGLYVSHQTPTSFEVHELGGGNSNVRFYYRIMALRRNYENIRFADKSNDLDPRKMMLKHAQPVKLQSNPASPKSTGGPAR